MKPCEQSTSWIPTLVSSFKQRSMLVVFHITVIPLPPKEQFIIGTFICEMCEKKNINIHYSFKGNSLDL